MGARNRVAWRAGTTTLFLLGSFLSYILLILGRTYNFNILRLLGIQPKTTGLRLQIIVKLMVHPLVLALPVLKKIEKIESELVFLNFNLVICI
jgi:hypothetical protein